MDDREEAGAGGGKGANFVRAEYPSKLEAGTTSNQRLRDEAACPEARLRERKWRLAVLSACVIGMIVIVLLAFVLQLTGRI